MVLSEQANNSKIIDAVNQSFSQLDRYKDSLTDETNSKLLRNNKSNCSRSKAISVKMLLARAINDKCTKWMKFEFMKN